MSTELRPDSHWRPAWGPAEQWAALEADAARYPWAALERALERAISRYEPRAHREILRPLLASPYRRDPMTLTADDAAATVHALIDSLPAECPVRFVYGGVRQPCPEPRICCRQHHEDRARLTRLVAEEITDPEEELLTGVTSEEIPEGPGWVQHCSVDGKPFRAQRETARYCSPACSMRAARARKARKEAAEGVTAGAGSR